MMSRNNQRPGIALPQHLAAQQAQMQQRPFDGQSISTMLRPGPEDTVITIYHTTQGGQIVCRILENPVQKTFIVNLGNQHAEFIDLPSARFFADAYVREGLGGVLQPPVTTPPPQ